MPNVDGYFGQTEKALVPMEYEDFPQVGLVLIRPSSSGYESLVSQIRTRSSKQSFAQEDQSKSVIFLNQSKKSVMLLQILWRSEFQDQREIANSCAWAGGESLLLPFGIPPDANAAMNYAFAILPGSKRYVTNVGEVIGDNSDVRPPSSQEIPKRGLIAGSGGGYIESAFRRWGVCGSKQDQVV